MDSSWENLTIQLGLKGTAKEGAVTTTKNPLFKVYKHLHYC